MSDEQPSDGVVFVDRGGIEVAFLGVVIVGMVRPYPCAWAFCQMGTGATWHHAATIDNAKAALRRRVREWFDALHTPLEPGQGERLAGQVRVG
jgi:hypothetical protein